MISKAAAVCPSCGGPVPRGASERTKDLVLILFIIAIVITSCWVAVDQTLGWPAAKQALATTFRTRMTVKDETVSVPSNEFRGVLVSVPYAGQVTLEVAAAGAQRLDVHVIDGTDLLRLANRTPPFATLELGDHPAFAATATPSATRTGRLEAGTYVVVLEHSTRSAPSTDARVIARLAP
jgi:hypothetical protein